MASFDVMIDGKTYHVEVPDPWACPLRVIVDGEPFMVAAEREDTDAQLEQLTPPLTSASPAHAPRPPTRTVKKGLGDVLAPMPGTILSVKVTAGQVVKAADTLCILEAMKMKNPIRAPVSGSVVELAISAGQNVVYHQLLFKIG